MIRRVGGNDDVCMFCALSHDHCIFYFYVRIAAENKINAVMMILRVVGGCQWSPRKSRILNLVRIYGPIGIHKVRFFQSGGCRIQDLDGMYAYFCCGSGSNPDGMVH